MKKFFLCKFAAWIFIVFVIALFVGVIGEYRERGLLDAWGIGERTDEIEHLIVEDFTAGGKERVETESREEIEEFLQIMQNTSGRKRKYSEAGQEEGGIYVILITFQDGSTSLAEIREPLGCFSWINTPNANQTLWLPENSRVYEKMEGFVSR